MNVRASNATPRALVVGSTGDVARVLGRPPRSLAQFTRDHADAWRVPSQEASS